MIAPALISFLLLLGLLCFLAAALEPLRFEMHMRRQTYLRRLEAGGATSGQQEELPELRKRDDGPRLKIFGWLLSALGLNAGAGLKSGRLIGIILAASSVIFLLLSLRLSLPPIVSLLIALGVSVGGVVAFLRHKAQQRLTQISDSVTELLELTVRALRVGVPVTTALLHAGSELIGPLREELDMTNEKVQFGQDLPSALYELAYRCQSADLRFFAAAVSIQMVTGGNLADVLEQLAKIARERRALRRKVVAITAEARWSGRFLSAFPIFAVLMISLMSPGYFDTLLETDYLIPIAVVVLSLLVVNVLFMRWLSNLK